MNSIKKINSHPSKIWSCLLSLLLVLSVLPNNSLIASAAASKDPSGFTYELNSKQGAIITGYKGPEVSNLVIPNKLNNFRVVEIGDSAFSGASWLEHVQIPHTVETISQYSFSFSAIKEITIPGSVKTVDAFSFYFCSDLEKVTLLYGIESIGDGAFTGCSSLKSVEMGGSTTINGDTTFDYIAEDSVLYAPATSTANDYVDSSGSSINVQRLPSTSSSAYKYIVDEATGEIIIEGYFGDSTTPVIPPTINGSSVTGIGDNAFANKPVSKVTLPPSLKTIGSNAFAGTGLKEIEIPSTVTGIGSNAFDDDSNLVIKGSCSALDEFLKTRKSVKFIPYGPGSELYYELKFVASPAQGGTFANAISREYRVGEEIAITAIPKQTEYLFGGWSSTPSYDSNFGDTRRSTTIFTMPSKDVTITAAFEKIPPEPLVIRDGVVLAYYGNGPQVAIPTEYGKTGQEDPNKVAVTKIGSSSYYPNYGRVFYSGSVNEINIHENITDITSNAFYGAATLNNITVATNNKDFSSYDGVLYNKDKSKLLCYPAGLTETDFTLPDSVTSIGAYAFAGNENIKTINLNNVTSVDSYAFYECSGLTSITTDKLVSIGSYSFANCTSLTKIHLPATLETIGSYSFAYCSSLATFTSDIECKLSVIPSYAFYGCAFTQITTPPVIVSVDSKAFGNNPNLTIVDLPKTMNSLAADTFYACRNLTDISVDPKNVTYESVNGVFFTKGQGTLLAYPPGKTALTYAISDNNTTTVANGAFAYSKFTDINLANVTSLGTEAFAYSSIVDIDLSHITSLSNRAFAGCTSLTQVTIPAIGTVPVELFEYCSNLTTVIVPNSVTSIGSYAFSGCYKLTNIVLPEGLTSIGTSAFSSCSGLSNINLPSTLKSIGSYAFAYCNSIETVTIPSSVTSIGNYAYYDCNKLTSVTFADCAASIGSSAFASTPITELLIPASITSIGSSAFANCKNLVSATINAPIIGSSAFANCNLLVSATLNEGITDIGSFAFENCALTAPVIPSSVTSIGDRPFRSNPITEYTVATTNANYESNNGSVYTKGLVKLLLYPSNNAAESYTTPDTVTTINSYAFENAVNLTSVTFKEATANLNIYLFPGCSSLNNVTVLNNTTVFPSLTVTPFSHVFSGIGSQPLVVRGYRNSTAEYEVFRLNTSNIYFNAIDETYSGLIVTTSGKVIGYSGDSTSISIPSVITKDTEGVTVVDNNKVPVTLGAEVITVTTIGSHGFRNPNNTDSSFYQTITSVNIPLSVKTIEMSAFDGCASLGNIVLPVSVVNIGAYAFKDCTSLTTVTLPKNVSYVGGTGVPDETTLTDVHVGAFYGCTTLTQILVEEGNRTYSSVDGVLMNSEKNKIYEVPPGFLGNVDGEIGTYLVPNDVVSIGESSFYGSQLTKIVLPDSMKSIGAGAFKYSFTGANMTIQLPSGLEEIQDEAFRGCSGITTINIPEKVERIGNNVFIGCKNLVNITVDSTNTIFFSDNGNLYARVKSLPSDTLEPNANYVALVRVPAKIVSVSLINDGSLVQIADGAFADCSLLQNVAIPNSVQIIGNSAFSGCIALNSVTFPTNLDAIGSNAFAGTNLNTCDLSNTSVGIINSYAFANTKISSIILPNAPMTIGNHAFYGHLASTFDIPASVTQLGDAAFVNYNNTPMNITINNPSIIFNGNPFGNGLVVLNATPGSTTQAFTDGYANITFNDLTAVVPGTLETPETPETPETSETPETPETSETPETPETPETSETPETPETPIQDSNITP